MSSLTQRLRSLVRETQEPWVVAYVVENLGRELVLSPQFAKRMHEERNHYLALLMKLYWHPVDANREFMAEKLGLTLPNPKFPLKTNLLLLEQQRQKLKHVEVHVAAQKFLKSQVEAHAKANKEQAAFLASLFREFNQEDFLGILLRLKDDESVNRWMAIQVAQNRWERLEAHLIPLLEDPVPLVRQAAHQALVKLSRGNDFGPAGVNPNRDVVRAAQKQWRGWLELQDR